MNPASILRTPSLGFALAVLAVAGHGSALAQSSGGSCLKVPVGCQVTSVFGPRYDPVKRDFSTQYHKGVDFGCPLGTPVAAAAPGSVIKAAHQTTEGNIVAIVAPGGLAFLYMHNERMVTTPGRSVNAGDVIAYSGNTGSRTTGPHLHFSVISGNKYIDPMPMFCSAPSKRPGLLAGGTLPVGDLTDTSTQPTAPAAEEAPAMGVEGGIHEVVGNAVASRALNTEYPRQLASLSTERLYAELTYLGGTSLRIRQQRAAHRERILATRALLETLAVERDLRPQVDAQRSAATMSTGK